jgi:methylmalonyl-CoA mutase
VNTFLNEQRKMNVEHKQIIRSSKAEKERQIKHLNAFKKRNHIPAEQYIAKLKEAAIHQENIFEVLMEAVKFCSLGQLTDALYQVGGKYSRNL